MKNKKLSYILAGISVIPLFTSCEDTKSYSDLLKEEEQAVNWYLANQTIVPYIPADSVFITGSSAPFYKMDEDGYVYMQIVEQGDMTNRPQKGQTVYFRFKYKDIKDLYNGIGSEWIGNGDNLEINSSSLVYGNTVLTSTVNLGEGLQVPLGYVGYNSEVNLVIKSPMGLTSTQTECIPRLYNMKYFKAEY